MFSEVIWVTYGEFFFKFHQKYTGLMFYEKMIEIVVKFLLNTIFGEEKRAKIRHVGAKNCLICQEFCPSCSDSYSMKCQIHVYLKSRGSDKLSDIWLDMESILEKKIDDVKFCEPTR